jgi:hypothetical protein
MRMNAILEANGWEIECESPFEIRHTETNSFVSGNHGVFDIYLGILNNQLIGELVRLRNEYKSGKISSIAYHEDIDKLLKDYDED